MIRATKGISMDGWMDGWMSAITSKTEACSRRRRGLLSAAAAGSLLSSITKIKGGAPKGGRKKSQSTEVQPCPILAGPKRN